MDFVPSFMQRVVLATIVVVWTLPMLYLALIQCPPCPASRALGCVGLALAALLGPRLLRDVFRRGPTIRLTEAGIFDIRLGVGLIPWKDISSVSLFRFGKHALIELWLRDPEAYVRRWRWWQRSLVPGLAARRMSPFNLKFLFLTPGYERAFDYIALFVATRRTPNYRLERP